MKIVADDKIPFLHGVFEKYGIEIVYKKGSAIEHSDLVDADALIVRTRTCCNRELLHDTKVKVVCSATIGTDHVNISELEELGISENWWKAVVAIENMLFLKAFDKGE